LLLQQIPGAEDHPYQRAERDDGNASEIDDLAYDENDLLGLYGFHRSGSPGPLDASS